MTDQQDHVAYVRNGRPAFFDDPVNDKLLAMIMSLLGEICVLRERLDAQERLAQAHGLWAPEDIDTYVPDTEAQVARARERDAVLQRVLKVLTEEVVRLRHE
ncbi:MAG: hypothetical protein QNJ73_15295 [Gammaproteobacteria bacterium]|nr:hypothetical protein [Gammaproteobacteria bacterium]